MPFQAIDEDTLLSPILWDMYIGASLLDILETVDTYYEIDEIILKMKKAEPIFCNPVYKNSELMFRFLFLLRVSNASFSYVFPRKIIIFAIS